MTKRNPLHILSLCILTTLAACNDEETAHPDASAPAGAVSFDGSPAGSATGIALATALSADDTKRFASVGAGPKIESSTAARLRARANWADGIEVKVTIDEFRLRTTSQVAWMGMMAGGDFIGAKVSIEKDGQVLKQDKVSAVSVKGGMIGAKEDKRLDRLVDELAENIANLL